MLTGGPAAPPTGLWSGVPLARWPAGRDEVHRLGNQFFRTFFRVWFLIGWRGWVGWRVGNIQKKSEPAFAQESLVPSRLAFENFPLSLPQKPAFTLVSIDFHARPPAAPTSQWCKCRIVEQEDGGVMCFSIGKVLWWGNCSQHGCQHCSQHEPRHKSQHIPAYASVKPSAPFPCPSQTKLCLNSKRQHAQAFNTNTYKGVPTHCHMKREPSTTK